MAAESEGKTRGKMSKLPKGRPKSGRIWKSEGLKYVYGYFSIFFYRWNRFMKKRNLIVFNIIF